MKPRVHDSYIYLSTLSDFNPLHNASVGIRERVLTLPVSVVDSSVRTGAASSSTESLLCPRTSACLAERMG